VQLAALADGRGAGSLATGPRGWQQGLAVLGGGRLGTAGDDRTVRVFDVASRRLLESRVLDDSVSALAGDGAGGLLVGLQGGQVLGPDGAVLQRHRRPVTALVGAPGLVVSASAGETLITRRGAPATLDRRAGALGLRGGELLLGVERAVATLDAQGRSRPLGVHRADVTALTGLDDGRVASGDAAGQLRWWGADGAPQGQAQVSALPVQALAAAPGLLLVASGRALEAWQLPSPAPPAWDERPTVVRVAGPVGTALAGFGDGRVRRLGSPGQAAAELELRHLGAVRALAEVPGDQRPEGLRLVSGGDDGRVLAQRWNGEVETLAEAGPTRVVALAVAPDGRRVAWALADGTLVLHSLEFGREIARLTTFATWALAFSPDGRRLAAGRQDKRLLVLDAETGAEVATSEAFDGEVTAVAWVTPASVVAARSDGAVSEYVVPARQGARRWTGPSRRVTALAVDPVHGRLAAGTVDGQVWVWALEGAAPLAQLPADVSEVLAVGFEGEALVFAGADRSLHAVPAP
jgi:WD40 repeat protein